MGVQILKAITGASVIAVDTRESALKLAKKHGADLTFVSGDDTVEKIREATGGRGADVVLDFVGADSTLAMGAASARQMGDLTIVGIAGGTLPLSFFSIPYEVSVQTTYWGSRPELVELLTLAARGLIESIITTYTLEEATDVYKKLKAGDIDGRAVIVPNASP
jgi:propanol-preferring alcohol dehydrogenase